MRNYAVFVKLLGFSLSLFLLFACGKQDYVVEHVKDFRFHIETEDEDILQAINLIVDTYNDEMGFDIISLAESEHDANSSVSFLHGIRAENNILGYGHWKTVVTEEGKDFIPSKKKLRRSIHYSMDLEFDFDNFKEKSQDIHDHNSGAWAHLYHLFSHEVGHGLQMTHEDNITSVMYMSIPDNSRPDVDYPAYFSNVRFLISEETNTSH
ncbi:MAG: hypothetical protein ACOH5I_01970 [Oligoflexus sp.]